MIDQIKLEVFLTEVTHRLDVDDSYPFLMRFMCRCLELIKEFLPEVGNDALETAKFFWLKGKGQENSLTEARIRCWNHLDAKGRSIEIKDKEDAAMRALLCVLYATPDSDDFALEAVHWFVSMLDKIGNYGNEVEEFMKN